MNSLIEDDDPPARVDPHRQPQRHQAADHEFTLGTGVLLVGFFGLVLLCGALFGLGYSMGGRKHAPVLSAASDAPSSAAVSSFNQFKPAAGAPVGASTPRPQPSAATTPTPAAAFTPPPAASASATSNAAPAAIVRTSPVETPTQPGAAAAANASFVVQVAAISVAHQQDADLLVSGLRAKGYDVTAHAEPDRFIHVQLGPYANRKDAEAMRTRLQTDGYQPYIK